MLSDQSPKLLPRNKIIFSYIFLFLHVLLQCFFEKDPNQSSDIFFRIMYLLLANLFGSTTLFWYFDTSNFSIPHPTLFSVVNLMHESLRVELRNRNIVSFSRGSVMWLLWQVWSAHELLSLWIFTRLTVSEPYCTLDNSSLYILYNRQK